MAFSRLGAVSSSLLALIASFSDTSCAFSPVAQSAIHPAQLQRRNTALLGYIPISEDSPRSVPAMEEWCTQYGVQKIEGIELYTEDGLDYQMITTVDIPAGTTVLYVPGEMVLSSDRVEQELNSISDGGVANAIQQLGRIGGSSSIPKFYLFLKVLMEYEMQENSSFLPYLNAMPRLYYCAVSMTDFCYECLPPLVFNLSRTEKVKLDNFVQVIKKVDIISDSIKNNQELLKWAFNCVYTRTYCHKEGQNEDDVALVPFADMFNHAAETEIEVYFDGDGNCMAYTLMDVPANSPLRISYGDPTNPSFLFARYGFLDNTSPAGYCKMMDIPKTPENINLGNEPSKMLFYHDTGDISQEVLDVVLYAKVLTKMGYTDNLGELKKQFYEACMIGDEATKAQFHEQYRYEVMKEILDHCNTFLQSLEALEKKSEGKSFDQHPRLPVILQHNEWVKETFLKVKANVEPLVQQGGGAAGGGGSGGNWGSSSGWEGSGEEENYYGEGEGYSEEYAY